MKLLEVKQGDKKRIREFLELPARLHRDDPNFIRPLDKDIEFVFDPGKNKFWGHGKAIRWILVNDQEEVIGRVAAFLNERTSKTEDQPTGGMGFFECIDDQDTANFLFDACKEWLTNIGVEAMDGPINFGDRNAWWGLLVDGFYEPVYQMNYNPPYYVKLFEAYGWQMYFKQFVLHRNIQDPVQPKFTEKYNKLMEDGDYHFEHYEKKNIIKYGDDFLHIYNNAWGGHANFKKLRREQAMKLFKSLKPILAPELAWFGYYKNEPIAFFIMIPDMNQVFKDFNGKFGLIQKIKTFFRIKRKISSKCYGIVFGVVPSQQGKGVDGGVIHAASTKIHPQGFWDHMEMVWIGDFNVKMLKVATDVGGEIYKTYHTMRYLFDRNKPYKRLPLMTETEEPKASKEDAQDPT